MFLVNYAVKQKVIGGHNAAPSGPELGKETS